MREAARPGGEARVARILIVEDDPDLRRLLGVRLRRGEHVVLDAADGTTGLAMARTEKPDMVLLDWMMPGISGIDVVREIRADEAVADLLVVMMSARSTNEDIAAARAAGADDYITKPVNAPNLLARVQALLPGD